MSIVKLKKATVLASNNQVEQVVEALQEFGRLHIIEKPNEAQDNIENRNSDNYGQLIDCVNFLEKSERKIKQEKRYQSYDLNEVISKIGALKANIHAEKNHYDHVMHEIKQLEPWGDFELSGLEADIRRTFWFYDLPLASLKKIHRLSLPYQVVNQNHTRIYVVVISEQKPVEDGLPEKSLDLPSESLSALYEKRHNLLLTLDELNVERIHCTKYLDALKSAAYKEENIRQRDNTIRNITSYDEFFSLEAWVPEVNVRDLTALSKKAHFALTLETPKEQDDPPTLLKPNSMFESGSLLAKIYQLPSYYSSDPSIHLYLSFSLFFALILSDVGYASISLLALLVFWKKMSNQKTLKVLRPLLLAMALAASVWGVLVNSFFGYSLIDTNRVAPVVDINNYDLMMFLAVGIGVVHIVIANIVHMRVLTFSDNRWLAKIGWILVSVGAYFSWVFSAHDSAFRMFASMIAIGLIGIFLFSHDSLVEKNVNEKFWLTIKSGFLALCNITKLFGDVLSYMRLFALGLASASLAITFNDLSQSAFDYGGVGLIGGCLIWLIGHSINFILGIMSGVVHGLRLNFIEFYNWSNPGEGYAFVPFMMKEV
ncbi:V-type ATP synthase subunit I [Sessilibacter corallicola]|uniref:V-type ATPase 116kDa subunit family protein n=1 Tax=Sessilibacter corallicola TaxID=2904075 RepID=A0ABQ0AAE3_9GAMM